MDGNEISVELRKRGYQGVLVHCSGIYMPTPETIKISPYRYILKQAEKEEVMKDLYDIFKEIARRKKVYSIEAYYKREKITVQTADITFITHHKNGKSILHVKESLEKIYSDGNIIAPYSFKELMNMLDKSDFAMPHSSYIVNLHYILGQREGDFIKIGTEMISISRSKKQEFKKKMMQYFGNKYPAIILTLFFGCMIGLSIGVIIGAIPKLTEGSKIGISVGIGMVLSLSLIHI